MTMRKCLALACLVLISSSMAFQIPARLPRLAPAVASPVLGLHMNSLGQVPKDSKVVIFGGNGFVGSRVAQQLAQAGATVLSISRTGMPPAWAEGEEWVGKVQWVKADAMQDDLSSMLTGSAAVVSCVGAIGGSDESMATGNGAINMAIIEAAAAAKVGRCVYVSVSDAVRDAVGTFALKGYFKGKKQAEVALAQRFPSSSVVLAPTFIYGGTEFSATPPRVAAGYGSFVEAVLSLPPTRALAKALPGLLGLALLPPVSVDAVAAAAGRAALGQVEAGRLDGTDAINAAGKESQNLDRTKLAWDTDGDAV